MKNKKQYQVFRVGLSDNDRARLIELGRVEGRTPTEVARDAIRWYLDNIETMGNDARESEVAQAMRYATEQHVKAIRAGVERICKMLARQGIAIGTLYELTWMALPDDEIARATFDQAVVNAKGKMKGYVEGDEKAIADAMQQVVDAQ